MVANDALQDCVVAKRASRTRVTSADRSSGSTFTATSRFSVVSWARYTSAHATSPQRLDDLVVTESAPDHRAIPDRESQIPESELETYSRMSGRTTGGQGSAEGWRGGTCQGRREYRGRDSNPHERKPTGF